MDVRLSPEQKALRDSVAQLADRLGPRSVLDLANADRAARLDAAVAQSGVRELRTDALTSAVEPALVAEQLARGLADAPFLGPTLAAELRRVAGLEPATAPETVAFSADLARPGTDVAIDAGGASSALVLVPDGSGHSLATVKVAGPPGNATAADGIDLTRPTVRLESTDHVPLDGTITEDQLTAWTALGQALATAELVGVMDGAIALAVEYATGRSQYGKQIGSFQAVQHLLADAYVLLEGARSAALHAAWAVDALAPDEALTAGAIAKAYAGRSALQVVETVIQVHGGNGNTWEYLPHVYLRRALVATDLFGGVGAVLDRVLAAKGI